MPPDRAVTLPSNRENPPQVPIVAAVRRRLQRSVVVPGGDWMMADLPSSLPDEPEGEVGGAEPLAPGRSATHAQLPPGGRHAGGKRLLTVLGMHADPLVASSNHTARHPGPASTPVPPADGARRQRRPPEYCASSQRTHRRIVP
ncbi:hypothetical protein GCM10022235_07430 [Kribbella ginsengisoli]|uniref:Uncharacterized protein n=1 Tax=Kribbella ginsengisoli TaxID=363865 RepID=A0ABP6VZ68_9ACTN